MTIKKYIIGYGIAISIIINIVMTCMGISRIVTSIIPCFRYYNNVDNAYSEEIGSPRRDVDFDGVIGAYIVYNSGSVTEIDYKNNTKEKQSSFMMYHSSVERMKKLLKKLQPMLENDRKEYENNKEMQYDVRLIKIYNKEYRIVSPESSKIIKEIVECIQAT